MARQKNKAVFLDRDGVLNVQPMDGNVDNIRQLRLAPGAAKAVREINRAGFLAIVVTNQGGIAHNRLSHDELDAIHAVLIKRLGRSGAAIDAIYYCPHHPKGTLKKYRINCNCRKPNIGMLMSAAKAYNVDFKKSFIIGDRTGDILAGKRAGVKTILVATGYAGRDGRHDVRPDFKARNVSAAVRIIKQQSRAK